MKQPILIFKGNEDTCYGIMRSFSEQLRDAFLSLGEEVIYLDPRDDFITGYANRDYKAVIAFMDTLFDNYMPGTDTPLFDFFHGPKFNYWSDHPTVFYHQLTKTPKDYYILTQDRNYADFINRFYRKAKAFFLPPGGKEIKDVIPFTDRIYDTVFIGTYQNWKYHLERMVFGDEAVSKLRDAYIDILMTQYDLTEEEAFAAALDRIGIHLDNDSFLELLHQMHLIPAGVVSAVYREKLIETILNNKLYLDVFGDSWYDSPFCDNPFLRIHPASDSGNLSQIYSNSKISLNIMTWHKDSITERVLDAMCAGSIVITDHTASMQKEFAEGEDILFYSLRNIGSVPELIRSHINDETMAEKGRQKALKNHLWINRAEDLLDIIDSISISLQGSEYIPQKEC